MTVIDTGTDDLLAEADDGVAVITMNRPGRRNALSPDMLAALGAVLAQLETDDAVGCIVLTGAGGAFCAGGDVKSMSERPAGSPASAALDAQNHRQRLSQRATSGRLWSMPSRRSPRSAAPRPALDCRSRSPATCGTRSPVPC